MRKHVLLTGGVGFIGGHTVEHILKTTDWTITVIDRLSYAGNQNRLTNMDCWEKEKGRVRFVYHDFRSPFDGQVLQMVSNPWPDYVVHMGAESHVDRSITNPMPFVTSNVVGTVNMLNLARVITPRKFIYVSTDEVYGAARKVVTEDSEGNEVELIELHKEGDPYNPSNPYSASKASGESFCMAYHKTYNLPIIITNTMNNFGERQDAEKFVPKVIKELITQHPVTIHCKIIDEKVVDVSSRCWLHARNHASGLLFLLENGVDGERYNIVGVHRTVEQVVDFIANVMQVEPIKHFEDFHSFRPGHDMHYGLDGSKLAAMGWKPELTYEKSMEKTVRWTVDNRW